ncbi:MFS transporter [Thermoproteota archaeon]
MSFSRKISEVLANNRNLQLLTLQAIVTQFCFGMFNIIWQPYLLDLQIAYTQLGLLQSIITGFTGIGSILWGRLSDHIGRKPAQMGSIICRIISIGFFLIATDWKGFIGFAVFMGLSSSWDQTNPVTTTLVSESVNKDNIGTAISVYSSAGTLIAIAAAPLGGYITVNQGYYPIFLSCIVGEIFNVFLANSFLKETLNLSQRGKKRTINFWKLLVPERQVMSFYIIAVLTMFSWRIAFSNLNAILVDEYQITPFQLGLMASTFSLSWGLSQAPVGTFVDRYPRKWFLLISSIGFMLIPLGYLFSRSFIVFIVIQIINGLAHSFGIPATTSMVLTRVNKEERATVLSKLATLPQLISLPAPLFSGYLYELLGFKTLLYIRFLFILITILVVIQIRDRQTQ